MDDKNELSDIVLNKSGGAGSNKKIILAVATLGVILIIVVMFMNSVNSTAEKNLPQAVLPPKPQQEKPKETIKEEPLFEEVNVVEEKSSSDADLDKIAQKLKEESKKTESKAETKIASVEEKSSEVTEKKAEKKIEKSKKRVKKVTKATSIKYYIQVGSFSKYEPNKKFLKSIKRLGFNYKYHKVGKLNKVLVGPFATQKEAERAKRVLRAKVEPGAFLVKL